MWEFFLIPMGKPTIFRINEMNQISDFSQKNRLNLEIYISIKK